MKRDNTGTEFFEGHLKEIERLGSEIVELAERALKEIDDEDVEPVKGLPGLQGALDEARTGKFDVAIVGEMNSGKSTFSNALFLKANILPMSATACTAKLTRIEYDDNWSGRVSFIDRTSWDELEERAARHRRRKGGSKIPDLHRKNEEFILDEYAAEIVVKVKGTVGGDLHSLLGMEREITREEISDYVAAGGDYTGLVSGVTLRGPHPLGDRVRIVDTPGLLDPDRSRSKLTEKYLERASVVIVILYAGTPMSEQDFDLLSNQLLRAGANKILVVLNKMDVLDEGAEERVVDYVTQKLEGLAESIDGRGYRMMIETLRHAKAMPVCSLLGLLSITEGKIPEGGFHEKRLAKRYGFETYDEGWKLSGLEDVLDTAMDTVLSHDGARLLESPLRKCEAALLDMDRRLAESKRTFEARLRDMDKDERDLKDELDDLNRAIAGIDKERDVTARFIRDLRREINKKHKDRVIGSVKGMKDGLWSAGKCWIERLGRTDVWSSAVVKQANMDLSWQASEVGVLRRRLDGYTGELGERISAALDERIHAIQGFLPESLDSYVIERVRFAGNLPLPDLENEIPEVMAIGDVSGWAKLFILSEAKADLDEQLKGVLDDWYDRTKEIVTEIFDSVSNRVEKEYWGPALAEVTEAVNKRADMIREELKARLSRKEESATGKTRVGETLRAVKRAVDDLSVLREKCADISRSLLAGGGPQ